MKILVSGASGLVGSKLVLALQAEGHQVVRLVRNQAKAHGDAAFWDPKGGFIGAAALAGADAAINLAGESIASGRWTAERKRTIIQSRVDATSTIANSLATLEPKPRLLINASAIGYYGSRGDEWLDESSSSGSGDFLSGVCRQWEAAAAPALKAGLRVVLARFGVILSKQGGALATMLTPFKLGLGGRIGDGRQYMSWIAIDDVIGAILHSVKTESLAGPVNTVAPNPVTNAEFTKTLGQAISRPTVFPMPAFAAKLVFGQMGEELLLGGQRVRPAKLLESGYTFKYPELETALRHVLQDA
jgi:uncharacterized protein (TIGR01777 family)